MALMYAAPGLARRHILRAASHQFVEGDVQHWWHPPSGAGVRTRISDDLLWLPYVVHNYVHRTGDIEILHEEIPFLRAPALEEEHELYIVPEVSGERGTLFEHCTRALERGLTIGPHGLPLIGIGDWNDGMNRVGIEGRGESVWLGWFIVDVLRCMSDLAERITEYDLARMYRSRAESLLETLEREAWDGEWYLRAWFDDGTPLGSSMSSEARIDSLPQSWAWLTGPGDETRARKALESAWQYLVREEDKLVLLFTPPFDQSDMEPGYIKGYPPGVRENGGQYTHAAIWLSMALARSGDGERAAQILRMLNPIEHARESNDVWRYGVEPYVVAADVYRLYGKVGQGGWTWYTGSAGWMYRAWLEEIIGFKLRGDHLRIDPVIPPSWEGLSVRYRHEEAIYEITIENPERVQQGVVWVEIDGRRLDDLELPLERERIKHKVIVRMGHPQG
jgi:cyclic beta-1,2-glucan synthetase